MKPKYLAVHEEGNCCAEGVTKDEALEALCDQEGLDVSNYESIKLYQVSAEFEVKTKPVISLTAGREL